MFFYVIFLVIMGLMLTEIPLKMIRLVIDKPAAKNRVMVRLDTDQHDVNLATSLSRFRAMLEQKGLYVVWPSLANFFVDWQEQDTSDTAIFLPKTIWYRRRHSEVGGQSYRQVLIFIHGGGMVAGSPLKCNSLNWITTVAWFGGRYRGYTDLLSLDYRLSPEYEAPGALIDCLRQIHAVCQRIDTSSDAVVTGIMRLHLIGFSAGGLLALQVALVAEFARQSPFGARIFDLPVDNTLKSFANLLDKRIGRFDLLLCSPVIRLDRLFLNRHTDVSSALAAFSHIFAPRAEEHDPLYMMKTHQLRLDFPHSITLIDVCRNSLSNHSIQLAHYLTLIGNNKVSIRIMTKDDFHINPVLRDKIIAFNQQHGVSPHGFLRTSPRARLTTRARLGHDIDSDNLVNHLHYHFFPFIVAANAAWLTLAWTLGMDDKES